MPGRSSRSARQAAEIRARRRVRTTVIGAIASVVAIVVVMAAVALLRPSGTSTPPTGAGLAGQLAQDVPASALRAVGAGEGVTPPHALPAGTTPLERDGKVEVLYLGAEYCPFCAAERWPLVVALSRFGSFRNLGATASSATDVFPNTPTFTFHGASYASDQVAFVSVETQTNQPAPGGGYTNLDRPTSQELSLLSRYDRAPYTSQAGAIPFLMIGNRYVQIGASYEPSVLQGMTRLQIARALSDPTTPAATAILGAANTLTAAICRATGGQPASVCTDPAVTAAAATLPGS